MKTCILNTEMDEDFEFFKLQPNHTIQLVYFSDKFEILECQISNPIRHNNMNSILLDLDRSKTTIKTDKLLEL